MYHCKDCGLTGDEDREWQIVEDGALVCYECPKCASPRVTTFDPD